MESLNDLTALLLVNRCHVIISKLPSLSLSIYIFTFFWISTSLPPPMALDKFYFLLLTFVFFALQQPSTALLTPPAISDLKDAIEKGLGFQSEDFMISGFDLRDAQVEHSVAYEFDLEIDNKVVPFKLLESVKRWEYVDLPIFRVQETNQSADETLLVQRQKSDGAIPVLAPFQLAGPMELWIQDAQDLRVSLPHDVDAGVLKKVILADGAVVTIKGARSVSLRHPLEFPLPFNATGNGFASGLLSLSEQLRRSSQVENTPLLSLRIVGPTSLAAAPSSSSQSASTNKLKLKRLAPGLVELWSPAKTHEISPLLASPSDLTQNGFDTLWPLTSINGSSPKLLGFEALLSSVLGTMAGREGSFRLVKADVSAQIFLKMGFQVEKKVKEAELEGFPEWRTKPEVVRMNFEVLAKVDGEKIVAEKVMQVQPVTLEDTISQEVLSGNITMSKTPIIYAPSNPLTL